MKKILFTVLMLIVMSPAAFSQVKINEGFETSDSLTVPAGWKVWNIASYYTDPTWNWMVRDTGSSIPGLSSALTTAHTGHKACGITWYACNDTGGGAHISDAWLVTKRVNAATTDSLIFWATGGSTTYRDSMQVWVGLDSFPEDFTSKLVSLTWPPGSTYGHFTRYAYSLSAFNGQTIWIGFRYNMDAAIDGYFVNLDDVFVGNPIGITPISTTLPKFFNLRQNYPNPFNPVTNIEFALPKAEFVSLIVYNEIGQQVRQLVNQNMQAGTYKVDFNASDLPSGAYFYRLTAGDFVKTNKMVLTK